MAHRRRGRDALPVLVELERLRGQGGGHLNAKVVGRATNLHRKAALAEHLQHAPVVGKHLRDERLDSPLSRPAGELRHQEGGKSPPAQALRDLEGDLGDAIVDGLETGMGNDPGRVADGRNDAHRRALRCCCCPVGGESEVGRGGEEAQPAHLQRQALQEAP